jgi:hypothetical protein
MNSTPQPTTYHPIDFTQWSTFQTCPMKWFETYVLGWRLKPADYQRDDALCVGSLYHDGMENFLRTSLATISQAVIDEFTPKPEALEMVLGMLQEYQLWAGHEDWQIITIEKPIEFQIPLTGGLVVPCMAKLDASVLVLEPTTIETGQVGQTELLEVGYYTYEHKTKAGTSNRAAFLRRWELDAQPLFQQRALEAYIKANPELPQLPVRGTIINVAEKPSIYIPVRTCKGCKTKQDMSSYEIANGLYVCRLCGHSNEFDPAKKTSARQPTTFYRIKLAAHGWDNPTTNIMLESIASTHANMEAMRKATSPDEAIANPYSGFAKCIHPMWGPCEFVDIHTKQTTHEATITLMQIDTTKYMKENSSKLI